MNIELTDSNVADNDYQLFALLKRKSKSTSVFQEAIQDFLDDFNKKYDTNISFSQVLNIYNNKNDLKIEESIILCKALLDFIQNNWIEITFKWKKHLLRYDTLASTNVALECDIMSNQELYTLKALSSSISSFINEVRKYFRFLIPDNTSLSEANVDAEFSKVPWMRREESVVIVRDKEGEKQIKTSPGSIKIAPWFVMHCEISEDQLKDKIVKLDNKNLRKFLEYVYEKIPYSNDKKHIALAKYLFTSYDAAAWQTIRRVLEWNSKFRIATVNKINIKKLKKTLFSNVNQEEVIGHNLIPIEAKSEEEQIQVQHFETRMEDDILYISEWVTLDLTDDETFQLSLTSLSRESVQNFFWILEELVMRKYEITQRYSAAKICELIQKSEDVKVETNVRQKITSLRTKPSLITTKFLNNNIDISNLRKFICEYWWYLIKWELNTDTDEGKSPDDSENLEKKLNKTFEFKFPEWAKADKAISLDIEFVQKKNLEWFIFSLNSLVSKELERQKVPWMIESFDVNDFAGIRLNNLFFHNVSRANDNQKILDMFDFFNQEDLELFLVKWHEQVWKKMQKSTKVYLEAGSKEELMDFITNKLERRLRKAAQKGRSQKKVNGISVTDAMLDWINSLTLDLVDKLPSQLFTRLPKKEVRKMIQDYLDARES